jgi:CelD/BcsL family acetyltransferase involved in cellulose biosynthesis
MGGKHPTPDRVAGLELERLDEFEPVAREWDELADRHSLSPWLRPGWAQAWWEAFGRGACTVLTARRNGRLTGVAALEALRGQIRSQTNWHTPEWGLVADEKGSLRLLAEGIYEPRPTMVRLSFLADGEPSLKACAEAARAAGYRLVERPGMSAPYIALRGTWEDFRPAGGRNLLRNVRRRRRRLEEAGQVTFGVGADQAALDELDGFLRLEAAGWKGRERTAISARPETLGFYTSVARWAADRGWLRMASLRLDGVPLATQLFLEETSRSHLLKTAHDERFRRFSPGILLQQELLQYAFDRGVRRFELLGPSTPYKLDWAADCRQLGIFETFRPSVAGTVAWAAFRHGRPLARRLAAGGSAVRRRLVKQ